MQDHQDTQAGARRSGVLLGCLGIGLVLVLLAGGGLFWWVSSLFTKDPQEIAALLTEILPGAQVPEGCSGQLGMDTDSHKLVLLASGTPSDGEPTNTVFIVVTSRPVEKGEDMDEKLYRTIAEQTGAEDREVENIGTEAIKVGGADVVFQKSHLVDKKDKEKKSRFLRYIGVLPARDGRVTAILIMGPADHFDRKGMDAFLASVAPLKK